MNHRLREKQILHNYMEFLAANYEKIEPDIMTDSICEIYDRLDRPFDRIIRCFISSVFAYTLVGITVFVVNLFRRKTR